MRSSAYLPAAFNVTLQEICRNIHVLHSIPSFDFVGDFYQYEGLTE